jgi:hypothetical protein
MGSVVRRSIVAVVTMVLMTSALGSAGARSLRIRHDGNDSPMTVDISRVVSDLSASTVYLRFDSRQRFHWWNDGAYFVVRLDTSGNRYFDRVLEIYGTRRGFICLLEKSAIDGDPTDAVGDLRATRPTERSVACSLPRSWFPRIHRAVRFYVKAYGTDRDRAPDTGLYRWL